MTTSPEQMQSMHDLDAAVSKVLHSHDAGGESNQVLTEYVVIAASQWLDEDAEINSVVDIVFGGAPTTTARALGLIEWARTRLKAAVIREDPSED